MSHKGADVRWRHQCQKATDRDYSSEIVLVADHDVDESYQFIDGQIEANQD